jgi:hypothetical protein
VLRLSGPLTPAVKYNLAVENVTNLNGLTGGGGETTVERPAPKDTTTARDSVPVGDSGAVRDTVPPDTASAPPDRLRPDTAGVPTPASSIRDGVRRLPFLPGRRW